MIVPLALAFGGVGYPSLLLALRGRVPLGGVPGAACIGDVATSSGLVGELLTSGAALGALETSGALVGALKTSAALLEELATSGADIGDTAPTCGSLIPFSPNQVSDLVAWYSADSGITLDPATGNVESWRDMSTTGDTATAPTTTAQPHFVASVPSLNGQPALEYLSTGASDPLNMALTSAGKLLTGTQTTTFIVCQMSKILGVLSAVMLSDATAPTPRIRTLQAVPWGNDLRWEIATGPSLSDGLVDLDPHLIVAELGATGTIRVDGVETASGPLFGIGYDGITIGSGPPPPTWPPTFSWMGYLAEILIYDRALTSEEISKNEKYLIKKYGL